MDRLEIIRYLSEARMAPYLAEAKGNIKNAIRLYEWHGRLSAEVKNIVGDAEIILRNAIDVQLNQWNQEETSNQSWLLENPAPLLDSLTRHKREQAYRQAKKEISKKNPSQAPSHHDVLAQITFGLWKEVLPNHVPNASTNSQANKNRETLWQECLKTAFAHDEDPDGYKTFWRVSKLKDLRNRVAHMDSLLRVDVQDYMRDSLFSLVRSISPDAEAWLSGRSQVNFLVKSRPKIK